LIRILPGLEELVLVSRPEGVAMPAALKFLLYLAAFVCFLLAAFSVRTPWAGRINLIGLGLACWVFINLYAALREVS
jgi:hypothetical protein